MLSDLLCEALQEIEYYERECPNIDFPAAEQVRRLKIEMRLLQLHYDLPPPVAKQYTPADYDWVRTEALKRAETKASHQFSEVIDECIAELGVKKIDVWETARKS